MTAQEFCYWLQGHLEISKTKVLGEEELKIVREHLQLVFTKVTSGEGQIKSLQDLLRPGSSTVTVC